jgi:hypothetical protein
MDNILKKNRITECYNKFDENIKKVIMKSAVLWKV